MDLGIKRIKEENIRLILLSAILLIGVFLRVYNLDNESLWLDEGLSIGFAKLNLHQIFFLQETNPPLYYIVLHWWINLFGDSEFSVRFPSVIFGSASIYMIYRVGNLIFNKDVGLLSSLLVGISVFHIRYSQEARAYSLSVFLTLLSIYFFIKLLRKSSGFNLVGYILFSALLMYSHIYGLFIILSQNIYFFVLPLLSKEQNNIKWMQWILIQIILILSFFPWANVFINQVLKLQTSGFWIQLPRSSSIINSFIKFSGSKTLFLLYLILAHLSLFTHEKIYGNINWKNFINSIESCSWKIRLLNTDMIFLLLVWLLTPILLPFIISRLSTPIYLHRYTIVASSAFYILVSIGIKNINHKHTQVFIILFILLLSSLTIRNYYSKDLKEQWRDAANYIDNHAKSEDLIVLHSAFTHIVFDYYSKRTDLIKKPFPVKYREVDEERIKELNPAVDGFKRVWVILSHTRDENELIDKKLVEDFNLSSQKNFIGINIKLYEKE